MDPTESSMFNAALDFQALFQAIPSPCLVLTPDFTIVGANKARLKVNHTSLDEILGHNLFEAFPDNPLDPAAAGVANLRASLSRVLQSKLPDTMAIQKYDIRKTPGWRDVRRTLLESS